MIDGSSIEPKQLDDYYYPRLNLSNLDNVPASLKRSCAWVAWREEPGDNPEAKPRKVPVNPRTGKNAKSNDPKTGGTYEEAVAFFERYSAMRGIGFILAEDDEFCGLDLDNVIDPVSGALDASAAALVRLVDSYSEVTASGSGLRIIVLANLSGGTKFKYQERLFEIYDRLRFLTVTGARVPNTPAAIWDRQETINSLVPASNRPAKPSAAPPRAQDPLALTVDAIGDDEIVKLIEASPRAEKFRALMAGETTGYSGYFAATLALAIIMAQFTRSNPERIDKIVRASGLVAGWEWWWDEKYGDGRTRGQRTIESACAAASRLWRYSPRGTFIVNSKGDPRPILTNAIAAIKAAGEFANVLAYNELSLFIETRESAPWQKRSSKWDDHDSIRLADWLQRKGIYVGSNLATEAAVAVARENPFHPIKEFLEKAVWDGTPRLDDWLATYLGATATPYTTAIGPRWLISAIARIYVPGCRVDHVLTLEGPQGKRKSTALQTLCGAEWFSDHLGDLGNKDSLIGLHGIWVIEFAELDAIKRTSQIERVKAFLTSPTDFFRPPYERVCKHVPRTNVFAATTNASTYLSDETGNRRFWPVQCGDIDIVRLKDDRDQLWFEALSRYRKEEKWWLEDAELEDLAKAEQEDRYESGRWDNEIIEWIADPKQRTEGEYGLPIAPFNSSKGRVTITDVLIHAIGKSLDLITKTDQNDVARCLRHMGWRSKKKGKDDQGKDDQRRVWVAPAEKATKPIAPGLAEEVADPPASFA